MIEKLWFRRKAYGWGWMPVSWEGWVAIVVYAGGIVVLVQSMGNDGNLLVFGIPFVIWTALLIFLCYKKGEKPKWQWGKDR